MYELAPDIKASSSGAVAFLYNRFGRKLYGYSVSRWKVTEDEAWELVYKTLYRAVETMDRYTFEDESKFSGFLFKIFVNYLRNHYRDNKGKHIETVELEEKHEKRVHDRSDQEPAKEKSPGMKCLEQELGKLEDWQRVLLLMRAQEFGYEEIGKYVDKPADQLKVYHMRLRKKVTEGTNECIELNKK